ncbi:hypothetical protein B0T25DRAFT_64663 [Lasiosphaeria hispida]|uniref:Uncharacterized protein n=1 Tax=Lasiosphaeria hispida TaxID=260671 RepID=A0AAJ0HXE4_9PEZI|nr:hypothetical protein B0T25DRAFT_64663 [Lasiosphaeria hispida]
MDPKCALPQCPGPKPGALFLSQPLAVTLSLHHARPARSGTARPASFPVPSTCFSGRLLQPTAHTWAGQSHLQSEVLAAGNHYHPYPACRVPALVCLLPLCLPHSHSRSWCSFAKPFADPFAALEFLSIDQPTNPALPHAYLITELGRELSTTPS